MTTLSSSRLIGNGYNLQWALPALSQDSGYYLNHHKIQGFTCIITRFRVLPALSQDSGYYLHHHRIQGITCIITGFRVLPALSQDSGYYLHYYRIQGITCIITGFRVLPALSQDSGYYLHYHRILRSWSQGIPKSGIWSHFDNVFDIIATSALRGNIIR